MVSNAETLCKDVAKANLLAMNWPRKRVYNIGTGRSYSINEIADMVGGGLYGSEKRIGEAEILLRNGVKQNT